MAGKQLDQPAPPAETRDCLELPEVVLSVIFKKIGGIQVMWPAHGVCRTWRKLALQPRTWRCIDMMRGAYRGPDMGHMDALARTAVDRSDGVVEEFRAEEFGNDELLQYIAERFTLLEEHQITNMELEKGMCAVIGLALPNLKRFLLKERFHMYAVYNDFYALEVADTMTQLKDLQFVGIWSGNNGLHTILDKCSNLDSLVITGSFDVSLDDGLKAKLANVKKVTVLPYESIVDYMFPK